MEHSPVTFHNPNRRSSTVAQLEERKQDPLVPLTHHAEVGYIP